MRQLRRSETIQLAAVMATTVVRCSDITVTNRAIHTTHTETGILAIRTAELGYQRRRAILLQCDERLEEIRAEHRVKALRATVES